MSKMASFGVTKFCGIYGTVINIARHCRLKYREKSVIFCNPESQYVLSSNQEHSRPYHFLE